MGSGWRLGGTYKYNGVKVVVSAINDDGTVVLNYASGSGRTGFAGKLASVKQPLALLPEGFLVDGEDLENVDEGGVSLDSYVNFVEVDDPMVGVREDLERVSEGLRENVAGWDMAISEVNRIHDEGTARLAELSGLKVDEYEFWLDNPERSSEPTWVGLEFDADGELVDARVVSQRGNLVTVQSNGVETVVTRYIGKRYMNHVTLDRVFSESDLGELEQCVSEVDY